MISRSSPGGTVVTILAQFTDAYGPSALRHAFDFAPKIHYVGSVTSAGATLLESICLPLSILRLRYV